MKKVLSIIMVLAMLLASVSVTVFADDLGSYTNPYQVAAGALTPTAITIPAESGVYVFVDDANGSTFTIGHATSDKYEVTYCRQPVYPEADGTMEFTMVSEVPFFYVTNKSDEAIVIRALLTAGTGEVVTGTVDNPEVIALEKNEYSGELGAYLTNEFAANNEGHYYSITAPADGAFQVFASAYYIDENGDYFDLGYMFFVNNITKGTYGDMRYSDDQVFQEELWGVETVDVSEGDELIIFATTYDPENPWAAPAGNVGINVAFAGIGSSLCPADAETGSHTTTLAEGNQGYYYQWTATEEGTVTVSIDSATGWMYSVDCEYPDGSAAYGDIHWSDDDPLVPSESFDVEIGTTLRIFISTYDPANFFSNPEGSVEWSISFVAGEVEGGGAGSGDGEGEGEGEGEGDDITNNFIVSDEYLQVGTNRYSLDWDYVYTVFNFEPDATGKYTFSSEEAFLGLVSSNGMWITVGESTDYISDGVLTGNTFEWTCTSVGQTIWVAVLGFFDAEITVDFEEVEIKEIPKESYENKVDPEAFVFGGNADDLNYVDTFDAAEDKAVLGEDGFYHLNAADGPILFANLNDPMMSLSAANGYGQLKYLVYDENGEIVKIVEFTEAMLEYLACMDEATGLYPLTEDLMTVFQKTGEYQGWYGEGGWIGGDLADSWMFACYYSEDIKGESDIPTGDNGSSDNGAADNNSGNTNQGNTSAPVTGDNVIVIVALAVVAIATMAAILFIRRRRAN